MMTPKQAMATVAAEVYAQHVGDHRYHASLGGGRCSKCQRLAEAATVLSAATVKQEVQT